MIIEELIIDPKDPFKNCKLNRKIQANAFLNLIPGFTKGGVIAINNKWGTGKTSFIKMLDVHLQNNQYTTIYFNAWENDFEDNPLSALVSELKDKFPNDEKVEKVIKNAAKIVIDIGSNVLRNTIEKYLGQRSIKIIAESLNNSAKEIFEEEIKEYSEKKKGLTDFRESLTIFVADNVIKQPLIFFIDELDRCRPNYAVKLLEVIKHLFSVPNILFILSIDKEQLGNSINGFYGSEKFNSEEYLRRFIDLEYQLPLISIEDFVRSTVSDIGLESLLVERYQRKSEVFFKVFNDLFHNFSLRQIEKIIIHIFVVIKSKSLDLDLMYIFQYLIFVKNKYPEFYNNISLKKITLDEIKEKFEEIFFADLENNSEENEITFASIEAELLFAYSNSFSGYEKLTNNALKYIHDNQEHTLKSNINQAWFKDHLESLKRSRTGRFKVVDLINIINLLN